MKQALSRCLLVAATHLLCPAALPAEEDKPPLPRTLNEQLVTIAVGAGWSRLDLETTLFVPPGPGPFPLVVINHGKTAGDPRFEPRARYLAASREFLRRGYLVAIPMRPGFAKSGGSQVDPSCNIESNGRVQAETIIDFLREMRTRPDVDADRILVIGQSHGGLAAMAIGAIGFPGLRGILNFAGGLRHTAQGCLWEQALVDAFAAYGRSSKIPSLWFYGDNDSYWGKQLPGEMYRAFAAAGGQAELVSYGTFAGGDAHLMFGNPQGVAIWWPESERFLRQVGLPTEVRFAVVLTPRPAGTEYADLQDVDAVPYLDDRRRELYANFLILPRPRAFAIAATGNVGWAHSGPDSLASALENCERVAKRPCALYAVDDEVVWPADGPTRRSGAGGWQAPATGP